MTDFKIALEDSGDYISASSLGIIVTGCSWPHAEPKTHLLSIPGADGCVDLSDVLRGSAVFSNVQASISFGVRRSATFDVDAFIGAYHGKRVKIRLGDDDNYYHVGRCWIAADDRRRLLRQFSMSIDADPYKYALTEKTSTIDIATSGYRPTWSNKTWSDNVDEVTSDDGQFIASTSLHGERCWLRGSTSVSPNTWYTFTANIVRVRATGTKYTLTWDDGTPITNEHHFYTGDNTTIWCKVEGTSVGAIIGLYNICLIAHDQAITNAGRKIVNPLITATIPCTLSASGAPAALSIPNQPPTTLKYTLNTTLPASYIYYVIYAGHCYSFVTNQSKSSAAVVRVITSPLSITINNVSTGIEQVKEYSLANLPSNARPLVNYATLTSGSDVTITDYIDGDVWLNAGANYVVAYGPMAGTVTLKYREGYL